MSDDGRGGGGGGATGTGDGTTGDAAAAGGADRDRPTDGCTPADSEVVFTRPMEITDSNSLGKVHGGVVMRAVDSAAGTAAARHAGRVCVTATIDGLSFLQPVEVGDILTVMARVNDVGRSSLEVGVRVEAESWKGGDRRHTTSAYLLMVALDDDGRPTQVPPLRAETDEDERRQKQARIRRELRTERLRRLNDYEGDEAPADG